MLWWSSCSQPLCSGEMVRRSPALLTICCCWGFCQAGTALHGSWQGESLLPSGKAFSADIVEGLERSYLQTASRFVVGSAFLLEAQRLVLSAFGLHLVLWSHRRTSSPRSQSIGFKMLGEDNNILEEGREHGAKDGWKFERTAREKELGEQSKAWLYVGMKIDMPIWSSVSRDQLFRKFKLLPGVHINISLMTAKQTRPWIQTRVDGYRPVTCFCRKVLSQNNCCERPSRGHRRWAGVFVNTFIKMWGLRVYWKRRYWCLCK